MVDGAEIVVAEDGEERRERLGSLAGAARFVGEDLFPNGIPDGRRAAEGRPAIGGAPRRALRVRRGAALERFRDSLGEADEASALNLWPEHFDLAFEAGSEERGQRAGFGVSPGDENHPEPYAYVAPWSAEVEGRLWNATGFSGAELGYQDLVEADDPVALARRVLPRALRGADPLSQGRGRVAPAGIVGPRAIRSPHRRRRLPGSQRGHPRRGPQGRRRVRPRVRRLPRRLARPDRERVAPARGARGARDPAARRHDPRLVADEPVQGGRGGRADHGEPRARGHRRPDRDRRRGHARRREASSATPESTSSASRRRSTTTSARPITRSASTPRSTSRWARSTASTRPPRATSGR